MKWQNSEKNYHLFDSHLREISLFHTYNEAHFDESMVPKAITFKDNTKELKSSELNKIIEKLLEEIKSKKRKFTDFKVLKQRDFNIFTQTGNIILKFKKYPLILKLFLETPESLSKPYSKAFQARGIFILGGSFRHLMGFTRIKNLENIQEKVNNHEYWKDRIEFPRKWNWLPKNPKYIEIIGRNLGNQDEQSIKVPSVYGIICDFMIGNDDEKVRQSFYKEYLKLCTFLDYTLDGLPNNFLLSKDNKILLIDTEHFAILSGIQTKLAPVTDYSEWYKRVAKKYIKEKFLSSKADRRYRQANNVTELPLYN